MAAGQGTASWAAACLRMASISELGEGEAAIIFVLRSDGGHGLCQNVALFLIFRYKEVGGGILVFPLVQAPNRG